MQCLLDLLLLLSCLAWYLLLASLLLPENAKRPIAGAEIAISSLTVEICDVSQMTAAEYPANILYKGNEVANGERKTVYSL